MSGVYRKLSQVQNELIVDKGRVNKFGGYAYRNAEDIFMAAKPLCQAHGLCLTVTDDLVMIGDRYYVKATARIVEVGEETTATEVADNQCGVIETVAFAREPEDKKGTDQSQVTGAASSYARKYAMAAMFALGSEKDADETETHGREQPRRNATQKHDDFL